jgi:hypothetical protein
VTEWGHWRGREGGRPRMLLLMSLIERLQEVHMGLRLAKGTLADVFADELGNIARSRGGPPLSVWEACCGRGSVDLEVTQSGGS